MNEAGYPLANRGAWLITNRFNERTNVCVCIRHIARLQRQKFANSLLAEDFLDRLNVGRKVNRRVVSDIQNTKRRVARRRIRTIAVPIGVGTRNVIADANNAFYDVVHVGKVANVFPVIEELDGFSRQNVLGKHEQGHVRPTPRSIDRKEPEPACRKLEQVTVAVGHQFIGPLGCRVELQRMVDAAMLTEWHVGVRAIDAARARVGQMIDLCISTGLENVGEGYNIAFDIGVWILQAVANTRLGREMNYPVERTIGKAALDGIWVGQVGAMEAIVSGTLQGQMLQDFQPGFLDRGRIVIIDDVHPDDRIAALEQTRSGMKANKSGIAGNQNSHVATILVVNY